MAIFSSSFGALLSLAMIGFAIVCWWKLYQKMEEPGWKALVPFYNEYTIFKRVWKPVAFVWYMLASIAFVVGYALMTVSYAMYAASIFDSTMTVSPALSIIAYVLVIVSSIVLFVISIKKNLKMAKCFGHGVGFGLGLVFLPVVFVAILALGNSIYQEPYESA